MLIPPIIYTLLLMFFLQRLYKLDLLFRRKTQRHKFIYFVQDVFDMFWLLFMWLPITLFAYYLMSETLNYFSFEIVSLSPDTIILFAICSVIIGISIVVYSTHKYHKEHPELVWSEDLKKKDTIGFVVYGIMELYNLLIMLIIFLCTSSFLLAYYFPRPESTYPSSFPKLSVAAIFSCIIFLSYFIMNTLSELAASIKVGPTKTSLFIAWQYFAGALITIFLIATISVYQKFAILDNTLPEYLKYMIGSLFIPLIPIVIQIAQIGFKFKDKT